MKLLSKIFILFTVLALVSCEDQGTILQEKGVSPEIISETPMTETEKQEVLQAFETFKSYGEETMNAYQALNDGETLGFYSPLGVTEPVDFEWSEYKTVKEHTEIMRILEKTGDIELFAKKYPVGTYLARKHVEYLRPELLTYIDNPEALGEVKSDGCPVVAYGDWYRCGNCQRTYCWGCCGGGCLLIVSYADWCRHVSTTCSCYNERKRSHC